MVLESAVESLHFCAPSDASPISPSGIPAAASVWVMVRFAKGVILFLISHARVFFALCDMPVVAGCRWLPPMTVSVMAVRGNGS